MALSTYDENTKWYLDTTIGAFINDHVYGKRHLVETNAAGVNTIVPNPKCMLPPDNVLVEVSFEDYQRLSVQQHQQQGTFEVDDKGKVYLKTPDNLTFDETVANWRNAVDSMMNATAKRYGYTNLQTAISYAEEPSVPKYQEEGKAFRQWRSVVWQAFYETVDKYRETKPYPTVEQVVGQMPAFSLEN